MTLLATACDGAGPADAAVSADASFTMDGGTDSGASDASRPDASARDLGARDADAGANEDVGPTLDWVACPDEPSASVRCATVEVPLDYDAPTRGLVEVTVRRFASSGPLRRQMWWLNGGPGQGSEVDLSLYTENLPGTEIYALGFRGSEGRDALICDELQAVGEVLTPVDESVMIACRESLLARWGDDLGQFSITNDARDVAHLVGLTAVESVPRVLMGVSFGSQRALRVLQVAPDLFAGAVLDHVSGPDLNWFDFEDYGDVLIDRTLAYCASDTECTARLGPDPITFGRDTIERTRNGHCPTSLALNFRDYQRIFYLALKLRGMLPSLLYRINRCEAGDELAVESLHALIGRRDEQPFPIDFLNLALHVHLIASEMRPMVVPTSTETDAYMDTRLVTNREAAAYRALYSVWPEGPADPFRGVFPTTELPLLMLQGEPDNVASVAGAEGVAASYSGRNQQLVIMPRRGHGIFATTPCGRALVAAFIENPTTPLDTSCVSDVPAVNFSQAFFSGQYGTADVWD